MAITPSTQMQKTKKVNMGNADRIVRGALGSWLFLNGMRYLFQGGWLRRMESLVGGAFVVYGITGFDPLLKFFGASTIPGAEDNILNRMKQTAPGQGINPRLTQQAIPQKKTNAYNQDKTVAESLSIR